VYMAPAWTTLLYFYIGHSLMDIGDSVELFGVLALGERPTPQIEEQNVECPTRNVQCRSAEWRRLRPGVPGEVEGANIIKIHRRSGKISYLVYPDFESDPHPALLRCIRLSLRTRELHCYDYAGSANPPILHRKETFLAPDHPLHAKFARLTRQEEQHGLLTESTTIGTRAGWQARLAAAGLMLRGHRVVQKH
jgi:hypothetical protein